MASTPDEKRVTPELGAAALDAVVRQLWEQSWGKARGWIETGKILVNGAVELDGRSVPGEGAIVRLDMNAARPGRGRVNPNLNLNPHRQLGRERVVHLDSQVVVIDKPPGISTVPYDRNEKGTLQELVCDHLRQRTIEVVHRIDKETSGLVVFARTREAARGLGQQFRFHTVHRRYLALVHGDYRGGTIRSTLVENRGDGLRGSVRAGWRLAGDEGQDAITHVRALESFGGSTLVECALETGRTHQIRIHLSEAGHPLLGEKLYIREFGGRPLTVPRVMLHAAELGFKHPGSGAALQWRREPPQDFMTTLAAARAGDLG